MVKTRIRARAIIVVLCFRYMQMKISLFFNSRYFRLYVVETYNVVCYDAEPNCSIRFFESVVSMLNLKWCLCVTLDTFCAHLCHLVCNLCHLACISVH